MNFAISKSKLEKAMKLQGWNTYEEVAAAGIQRGTPLSARNLYKLAAGANYTRATLDVLCRLLDCTPGDLIEAWHGRSDGHTHGAPRPEEKQERVGA